MPIGPSLVLCSCVMFWLGLLMLAMRKNWFALNPDTETLARAAASYYYPSTAMSHPYISPLCLTLISHSVFGG